MTTRFVPDLGRTFGFSAHDLTANSQGRFTLRQKLRLGGRSAGFWLLVAAFALLSLVFVGAAVVVILRGTFVAGLVSLGIGATMALGVRYFSGLARRASDDLRAGVVTRYEGPTLPIEENSEHAGQMGHTLEHYLLCGERKLAIPYAAYRVIRDGSRLRVFYASTSDIVLSAEPLSQIDLSLDLKGRPHGSLAPAGTVLVAGALLALIGGLGLLAGFGVGAGALVFIGVCVIIGSGLYALGILWGISG